MADEIASAPDGEQVQRVRVSGGRWLAILALLVALTAACGVAYLYYTLVVLNPATSIDERLAALQTAQSQLRADLTSLTGEQQATLETFRAEQEEWQRASEHALGESLGALAVPELPSDREWKLAEAEFLLRAANHRALFERNASAALELLGAADDILGALASLDSHQIRRTIASEIASLERAQSVDPSNIYLRLDAIKRRLADLTLALPEYTSPDPSAATPPEVEAAVSRTNDAGVPDEGVDSVGGNLPASMGSSPDAEKVTSREEIDTATGDISASEDPGIFAILAQEFGRLIRFRRIDTALERPPTPAEREFLELNLRLMLEQAQLAALRRDQSVYASSLDSALTWTRAFLDSKDAGVRQIIDSLDALRHLQLDAPLPDISGSLNELLEARR